jgi:hypothetical protein
MFDGNSLRESQTPGDLDMSDGDVIDACLSMIGGAMV